MIRSIKIILTGLSIVLLLLKNIIKDYDVFLFLIMFIFIILDYLDYKNYKNKMTLNILFWIIMSSLTIYIRNLNFDLIYVVVILLKVVIILFNYYKFKHFIVPNTIISKLWIIILFLYLSELILNSTHGLKNLFFIIGLVSSFETFLIILKIDVWKPFIKNIFNIKNTN